ncbi:unnamed protein product, partial [Urochloa humidicola]
ASPSISPSLLPLPRHLPLAAAAFPTQRPPSRRRYLPLPGDLPPAVSPSRRPPSPPAPAKHRWEPHHGAPATHTSRRAHHGEQGADPPATTQHPPRWRPRKAADRPNRLQRWMIPFLISTSQRMKTTCYANHGWKLAVILSPTPARGGNHDFAWRLRRKRRKRMSAFWLMLSYVMLSGISVVNASEFCCYF